MDQITVWSYTPSAAVTSVADRVGFTDKGTFFFHATRPEVATADAFNRDCPRQEPSSPILGCYTAGRIFIYDITNQRLNGIEEVTAAHEMLHAAWERLSEGEKSRLTTLLKAEYTKHATGELADRIAYYERNEPGQVVNELHSILPTEVKDLSPELETYYKQYFQDRQKVVSLHDQYNTVFKQLNARASELYTTLTALSRSVEIASAAYEKQANDLSSAIAQFNARADRGDFSSQQQFSTERAALVAQSNAVQASRNSINADIDRYNSTYSEYQQVAKELDTLSKSLDSIQSLPQSPSIEE